MSTHLGSGQKFMDTGMTPRSWRMLTYCAVGFFIYGFTFALDALQNMQLNRIDRQMQMVTRMEQSSDPEMQESVQTAVSTDPAAGTLPSQP